MLKIDVITVGKIKAGPHLDLWNEYEKRLPWPINLIEITGRTAENEHQYILQKLNPRAFLFVLDEKGKTPRSLDFAKKLNNLAAHGDNTIQFVIGGADGLSPAIRKKADYLLSFGAQTWPHKLVRVMLIEQLYRTSQIIAGNPYHRE